MGAADRDYWKKDEGERMGGPGGRCTPVVGWLLMLNVAVFFGDVLVLRHSLEEMGAFSIRTGILGGRVWEWVTCQFLHGSIGHLVMNLLGLYVFGPLVERWWGARRFAVFYLACGAAGPLAFTLLWALGVVPATVDDGLIGASAGLFGVLIGAVVIAPNLRVSLIFPPVEMSMRQLAMLALGIAVLAVLTGLGGNAGGEAGHLGGAALGYLLMRRPGLLAWAGTGRPEVEISVPRAFRRSADSRPQAPPDPRQAAEVDRILDKISAEGMHSLTRGERKTLARASKSRQSPP